MHTPHVRSGGRYPVLRALAIIYVIGAALAAIAAIIGVIWALAAGPGAGTDRLILAAAVLGGGFVTVISMLAIAEVLKLFIDLEHNTRMAAPGIVGMPAAVTPEVVRSDGGGATGHPNRIEALDDETAEAALMRGH
jgi:hypothetical protein